MKEQYLYYICKSWATKYMYYDIINLYKTQQQQEFYICENI
jgi:hypothetical protein